MDKEGAIGTAIMFAILGLILGVIVVSLDLHIDETVYALMGFAIFFYVISYFLEPRKTEWICQKCHTKLVRKQIKFGLCPNCGIKVKDFRGLRHNTNIYGI